MKGFGNRQTNRKKGTSSSLQKEINKITKSSNEQLITKALKYHSEGDFLNAERYYKLCLKQESNDPRVLSNYGLICKEAGRFEEAIKLWKKSIELYPENPTPYYNLSNLLIDIKRFKEAEVFIKAVINIKPDDYKMHYNLGITLRNNSKEKEAISSFQNSLKLKPDFTEALSNLSATYLEIGNIKDAKVSIKKAIEVEPKEPKLYLNLSKILQENSELKDAEKYVKIAINLNPKFAEAHSNLATILIELGNLKEAELSSRKAIELNPDFAPAYSNIATVMRDIGNLKEAELSIRKAIDINSNYAKAYYILSLLKSSKNDKKWQHKLFSKNILNNQSERNKIDIYFARSNIHHMERNYKLSSNNLILANNLKLNIEPSNFKILINKSKELLIESEKIEINQNDNLNSCISIFIVGMPRSGSTLLESILSMNNKVKDLGEINILEEAFEESKRIDQGLNFYELYRNKTNKYNAKCNITTNKLLYNYQYAGIISKGIINSKIIHCFRNPLDNILSIYRAHFAGNEYSSSLVDCAKVYLDQEEVMTEYKNRFRSKIYDFNYDLLVTNPHKEIKSLISWLGWEWNESYLSPHLNQRSISTASSVQARSPINSKSIGGWKNYKEMLQPAMEILSKADSYQELTF